MVTTPVNVLLLPAPVVTLTFLGPRAAKLATLHVPVTVVAVLELTVQVTPPPFPETVIAVAPDRPVPVRVTALLLVL